jgi:hypothetical protein
MRAFQVNHHVVAVSQHIFADRAVYFRNFHRCDFSPEFSTEKDFRHKREQVSSSSAIVSIPGANSLKNEAASWDY